HSISSSYIHFPYTTLFRSLYKFLFEDDYFRKLSDSAKIAYCIFRDRFELSKINNWIDQNGNVYLIFTTKDLCNLLNCGTQKVTKDRKSTRLNSSHVSLSYA